MFSTFREKIPASRRLTWVSVLLIKTTGAWTTPLFQSFSLISFREVSQSTSSPLHQILALLDSSPATRFPVLQLPTPSPSIGQARLLLSALQLGCSFLRGRRFPLHLLFPASSSFLFGSWPVFFPDGVHSVWPATSVQRFDPFINVGQFYAGVMNGKNNYLFIAIFFDMSCFGPTSSSLCHLSSCSCYSK